MTSPLSKRMKLSLNMDQNYSEKYYDNDKKKIIIKCLLCNKLCDTDDQLNNHEKSKNHLKKLTKQNEMNCVINDTAESKNLHFYCEVCNIQCNTFDQLNLHNSGKSHKRKSLKDPKLYEKLCQIQSTNINNLDISTSKNTESIISIESQSINTIGDEGRKVNEISSDIMDLLKPLDEGIWITCKLCNIYVNTQEQYITHCNGSKHKKKFKSFNIPDEVIPKGNVFDEELVDCKVCNIKIHKNNKESHDKGKSHKEKLIKSKTDDTIEQTIHKTGLTTELKHVKLLKFKPRKYQQEIYEKANEKDCVVFMPTGTGKTFVAIMLIMKMLEENPYHRVAFLVDKVLLVIQQCKLLKEQFEDITMNRFKSINETEHRKLRIIGLANEFIDTDHHISTRDHDVVVATADYFKNTLNKKQMYWTDFSLVTLDEAHHCVKEHPYNKLLFEYHLYPKHIKVHKNDILSASDIKSPPEVIESELEIWKTNRCKIIGLTASPAGELEFDKTYDLLKTLLHSLGDVSIVTVTENIEDLNNFTSLTNIESRIVKYEKAESELRKLISNSFIFLLKKFERQVNGIGNNFIQSSSLTIDEVNNLKNQLYGFLADVKDIEKTILNHILTLVEIIEAIDNIGYTIAKNKFNEIIDNQNEKVWFDNNILNFAKLSENFQTFHQKINTSSIISEIAKECRALQNGNRTILILVKERKVAYEYKASLKNEDLEFDCHLLLGHGSKGTRERTKGMSVIKQKQALDFIREKRSQIIIATSVADEGIDLPECDLVIIVNPPNSVQALVQIRGRARKKTSKLLMLCREQKCIDNLEELKIKEENIQNAITKLIKELSIKC